jgi:hypothetical protein
MILFNYPPYPEVRVPDILASTCAAFAFCSEHLIEVAEHRHLLVGGHSASSCLVRELLTQSWLAGTVGVLTVIPVDGGLTAC